MLAAERQNDLRRYGLLIHGAGLAVLLCLGMAYYFAVAPILRASRSEDTARETELLEQLENAARIREEHALFHERLTEAEELADSIRERIPDQAQESQFLGAITDAASKYGISIRNFAVGKISERDTHYEVAISFGSSGDYVGVCRFLDTLMAMPRVVTVEQLTIHANDDSEIYPFTLNLLLPFAIKSPEPSNADETTGGDDA